VICFLLQRFYLFPAGKSREIEVGFAFLCKKGGKIEKFRACQAQRLEALLLWNPNGRLGSDGGWQASLYPPLRMADLVLGQKPDFFEPCLLFK